MRNVSEYLKGLRLSKGISRRELEAKTKIKTPFIEAIEEGRWDSLPDYTVVVGFIKNIASQFSEDPQKVLAMLRRDYPLKTAPVNPKPDVSKAFSWGPKMTFLTGVGVLALILIGYLAFQYAGFVKAPYLRVDVPVENETVSQKNLTVSGKTDPEATVKINNQPVLISEDGNFKTEIEVSKETGEVVIVTKSRAGKETKITRKIKVEVK